MTVILYLVISFGEIGIDLIKGFSSPSMKNFSAFLTAQLIIAESLS